MLKLSAISLATLILLQVPASIAQTAPPAAAGAVAAEQASAARIDALIAPLFKADGAGATVIVVRDGRTLLRKAYGMADTAKGQAMTPDTSLRIGSITKQFTAAAILLLAEEGKLSLSDDITKFLPDYPSRGKRITVEHLLTHTSGIVSYTGKNTFVGIMQQDMTVAQLIDFFKNDPLEFEPGARFAYNNSGYFLLGAIIEKVSGQPYAKFVEQRIFIPLGMTRTAYEGHERSQGPRAAGHSRAGSGFGPSKPLSMALPYAAGSLVSTVDDLARWDAAITSGKLLTPASLQKATTPYTLSDGKPTRYGYGWALDKLRGKPMIAHGGGINGFASYALRLPEQKLYVAVLTNADSGLPSAEMIAVKSAAIAAATPFPEYKTIKIDPALLDAYAGIYKFGDVTWTVRRDNDQLTMQRGGGGASKLSAYSDTGFYRQNSLTFVEFGRDAKGTVSQLSMGGSGDPVIHARTGDAPPERKPVKIAAEAFDALVGRYQLAPAVVVDVSRDGERYWVQLTGQDKLEVFPQSDSLFFARQVDAQVRFEKAADGGKQLVLMQGGRDTPARRID